MAGQVASAGSRLRSALEAERPLQVVRVINAYAALMAERVLGEMQTRDELYDFLRYHEYEEKLDRLFAGGSEA